MIYLSSPYWWMFIIWRIRKRKRHITTVGTHSIFSLYMTGDSGIHHHNVRCRIDRSLSYMSKFFNYLCHVNVEQWHKIFMFSPENLARIGLKHIHMYIFIWTIHDSHISSICVCNEVLRSWNIIIVREQFSGVGLGIPNEEWLNCCNQLITSR